MWASVEPPCLPPPFAAGQRGIAPPAYTDRDLDHGEFSSSKYAAEICRLSGRKVATLAGHRSYGNEGGSEPPRGDTDARHTLLAAGFKLKQDDDALSLQGHSPNEPAHRLFNPLPLPPSATIMETRRRPKPLDAINKHCTLRTLKT